MIRVTSTSTGKTSLSLDWSLMVGIFVLRNAWFALQINSYFNCETFMGPWTTSRLRSRDRYWDKSIANANLGSCYNLSYHQQYYH